MKKIFFSLICFGILPNFLCERSIAQVTSGITNSKPWNTENTFKADVFVENLGQFNNWVKSPDPIYYAINNSDKIFFSKNGLIVQLKKADGLSEEEREEKEKKGGMINEKFLVKMQWLGCNENPILEASDESEGYYTFGEKGFENVMAKGYRKLVYKELYPGIDVEYIIPEKGGIKYSLIIHPGADAGVVKMKYSGDVEKMEISKDGIILIKTEAGEIMDHAPMSFYRESLEQIASSFVLKGNTVSFKLPFNTSQQTIVIDPWTITPTSLASNSAAFDTDYDFYGNVYVSGGTGPFKLSKYSNAGNLLWTFTNPAAWGMYTKFCLIRQSGTVFIGQGFSSLSTTSVMKINPNGTLLFTSAPFTGTCEIWRMFYNRCTGQLIGFGGGIFNPNNLQLIADTNLSSSVAKNFNGYGNPTDCCNDITSVDMDNNGDFFALMSSYTGLPSVNNRFMKSLSSSSYNSPSAFDVTTGYNFEESNNYGIPGLMGSTTVRSNAISVNSTYAFSYDGRTLIAFNKTTGAQLSSVIVNGAYNGGKNRTHEGIDVDECNNVYVGGTNKVHVYSFNGTSFTPAVSITTNISNEVYDVCLGPMNKLYVCGAGFVTELLLTTSPCNQIISLSTSATNSSCASPTGTATVIATGGIPPYTYLWSPSGQTTATATGLPAGTYTVIVTDASVTCNNPGNMQIDTITITSSGNLAVSSTQTNILCNGGNNGSITATVTGGTAPFTYLWSNSQTNATATNLSAGSYSVTITDANGCSAQQVITLTDPTALSLSSSGLPNTCFNSCDGQLIVIPSGGTSPYNFLWSTGCTNPSCNAICAGSYSITITDANGCTQTQPVTVTQPTALTQNQVSTNANCGVNDGSASTVATGGVGPYTYNWQPGNGTTSLYSNLGAGQYTCTVTDANACTSVGTVVVSNTSGVTITSGPITNVTCNAACDGALSVTASGGASPYTYAWSPSGGNTSSASNLCAGTYTCTITDANGCINTQSFAITEPSLLSVVTPATPPVICVGSNTNLSAIGAGGSPAYSYLWQPGGLIGNNPAITPTLTTTYTVTITDANGCSASATELIVVNPVPIADLSGMPLSGCAPLQVDFSDSSSISSPGIISTWLWNFGDGNTSTLQNPSHIYLLAGNYTVSLTITSSGGCSSIIVMTNYVTVYPSPVAGFSASTQSTTLLEATISFTDQSSGATSWQWNFGDVANSNSSLQNPSFTFADTGCYRIQQIVMDANSCRDTAVSEVCVRPDWAIYVPNAFTPNEDGLNDLFMPMGFGIEETNFEMWIFDRWGNLIFDTENMHDGWNGKANGGAEIAQMDTYVWKIKCKDVLGDSHKYVGKVSLIK